MESSFCCLPVICPLWLAEGTVVRPSRLSGEEGRRRVCMGAQKGRKFRDVLVCRRKGMQKGGGCVNGGGGRYTEGKGYRRVGVV